MQKIYFNVTRVGDNINECQKGMRKSMKSLFVLSHCILNNAAKVEQDESELEEEYRIRDELMELISEQKVQMLQLPCPEFMMYGSQRWGHVKEQFEHPYYKEQCRTLLQSVMLQLEEYMRHPESFRVLGVISVEGSPNCGYHLTCSGSWKGEIGTDCEKIAEIQETLQMVPEAGVYMQLLEEELQKRNLDIPIVTMEEAITLLKEQKVCI